VRCDELPEDAATVVRVREASHDDHRSDVRTTTALKGTLFAEIEESEPGVIPMAAKDFSGLMSQT